MLAPTVTPTAAIRIQSTLFHIGVIKKLHM